MVRRDEVRTASPSCLPGQARRVGAGTGRRKEGHPMCAMLPAYYLRTE